MNWSPFKKIRKKLFSGLFFADKLDKLTLEVSEINASLKLIAKGMYSENSGPSDCLQADFAYIYDNNVWGSGSGFGSDYTACSDYIDHLDQFISTHGIKSISDVGCGDWQSTRRLNLENVQYNGYDVVKSVISINNKVFQKPNIKFHHYDGDFSNITSADLVICKDVLQHLSNGFVDLFIKNLSRFKYGLITNDFSPDTVNLNIANGGYRYLDVRKPPFMLTADVVYEFAAFPHKKTLLWINPKNSLAEKS